MNEDRYVIAIVDKRTGQVEGTTIYKGDSGAETAHRTAQALNASPDFKAVVIGI